MGTFQHSIQISDLDRRQTGSIDADVNTGAAFTVLPGNFLRDLGVQPIGQKRLLLADGSRVDMDYGRAWATVEGIDEVTLVVFGRDDGPALLGAYTLEGMSLAVDPESQRLIPTTMILYEGLFTSANC